jgi:hypothetical protein
LKRGFPLTFKRGGNILISDSSFFETQTRRKIMELAIALVLGAFVGGLIEKVCFPWRPGWVGAAIGVAAMLFFKFSPVF